MRDIQRKQIFFQYMNEAKWKYTLKNKDLHTVNRYAKGKKIRREKKKGKRAIHTALKMPEEQMITPQTKKIILQPFQLLQKPQQLHDGF